MSVRGEFIGVSAPGQKRAAARRTLRLAASSTTRKSREVVEILNLSVTGMLIETSADLAIGETLQVELPEAGPVTATVTWTSDRLFGCRFGEPLPSAAVSAAMLMSEPEPPSADAAPDVTRDGLPSFPARMRQLREARGLSLEQVARKLGVSRQTVWYWERGRNLPGEENFRRLARYLQVRVQDLSPDHPGSPADDPTKLAALVEARKIEIAEFVGTTDDKVRIIIEL